MYLEEIEGCILFYYPKRRPLRIMSIACDASLGPTSLSAMEEAPSSIDGVLDGSPHTFRAYG